MSGFDQIDEAVKAGARAENADFATPTGTAGINPLKMEKRKIFIPFHFGQLVVSGAVTDDPSGTYAGKVLPDAGAATYMLLSGMAPRGEVAPGEPGILHIFWRTTPTTGNARFVCDIRPIIDGSSNLASAVQRATISAANGSANALTEAKMNFPPAIFSNNQQMALKLYRDPTNSLDTIGASLTVHAVYLEILGRC